MGPKGTDWSRRGPEEACVRDAPRPGQLEEQLCVRCGGVRIFGWGFGWFTCLLRFPRQGTRSRPVHGGFAPSLMK